VGSWLLLLGGLVHLLLCAIVALLVAVGSWSFSLLVNEMTLASAFATFVAVEFQSWLSDEEVPVVAVDMSPIFELVAVVIATVLLLSLISVLLGVSEFYLIY
jgi:hypothetical protein